MVRRICIVFIFVLLIFQPLNAFAEETNIPEEYDDMLDSLPSDIAGMLPDEIFSNNLDDIVIGANKLTSWDYIFDITFDMLGLNIKTILKTLATVIGLLVISSLLNMIKSSIHNPASERVLNLVSCAVIVFTVLKLSQEPLNRAMLLLEDIKTVNIGNEMAVTISVGVGLDGLSYAQNYEFARNAIDLALGRGGDQAVVKTPASITYYGGKSQQVEKNTRVKARVKAHALKEIITSKDKVFIMGHRLGDVDSFGASVGIYRIAQTLDRKAHIVLNDMTTSMQPLVELFVNNPEYDTDMILNNQDAIEEAAK